MTGNTFAGQICAYCCSQVSSTDDHVFAKKFFAIAQRDNLPQVPACPACNGAKQRLETELMVVLPFGGRHADASDNLAQAAARRFINRANLPVARALQRGVAQTWNSEGSIVRRGMTVPIDWNKVDALFEYIARGLTWHEFDHQLLGFDCFVQALSLIGPDALMLRRMLRAENARRRIHQEPGNGTFRYWGAQAADNPQVTVWEFEIYGGLRTADSPHQPHNIGVMTGPMRVRQKALVHRAWREGTRLHRTLPGLPSQRPRRPFGRAGA
jgi:hypothetical protein